MEGLVVSYSDKKGLGFISGEDDKQYIVFYNDIIMEGFQTLQRDNVVTFDPIIGRKGPIAKNVKRVK